MPPIGARPTSLLQVAAATGRYAGLASLEGVKVQAQRHHSLLVSRYIRVYFYHRIGALEVLEYLYSRII